MHTGFVRIWEIRDLIPICESMHMGIAVCIRGLPYAYGQGLLRVRIRGVPVRIMKSCAYGDQHIYIIRVVVYGCNNPPVDEQERLPYSPFHPTFHTSIHISSLLFTSPYASGCHYQLLSNTCPLPPTLGLSNTIHTHHS